jgi:beta-N-acetylhexosaminidase
MTTSHSTLPRGRELSLREKLAQLTYVRIGSNLPPIRTVEEDRDRILEIIESCPIGGLLLFNGGTQTKLALQELQAASKYPLLVAADMERGVGQQIRGYTIFPHAMAFQRQPAAIEAFVDVVARDAHDAGVHITFGPVADVNTNPRNPIISIRAFSEDPHVAAELTAAYVRAAECRGLMSTAKHFPGHGDTHQDSHDSLPVVERTLDELRACELQPFQAAIDAHCSLVMTAHVAFPQIDPSGAPATLSPILLKKLLRDEMGFTGAVCSDSLLMAGVRDRFASEGEMALATLNAGVDMLLDIDDPAAVVDYLAECVGKGLLLEARVDEAFERVWALKQKAIHHSRFVPPPQAPSRELAESYAKEVARMAVEVLSTTEPTILPLDPDEPLAAILLKPFELPSDPPEQPLADALRGRFRDIEYMQLGPQSDAAQFSAADRLAHERPHVLVAMIVKPAAWHAFGLLPAQREFVERLTQERSVVLACLGVPYALRDYPRATAHICTYSDVPVSQEALAEFVAT